MIIGTFVTELTAGFRNPPIAAASVTFLLLYVILSGCDWWISIRSVNNTQDWRKFPRVFCFPNSRINENGGNKPLLLLDLLVSTRAVIG